MAGHSKWKKIKHQKGATDAKRGQLFTKLAREIAVVVREGGPNVDGNYRLRLVVQKARDSNMPLDNIERAIKRGAGGEGEVLEEVTYECYGPGGVALLLTTLTSNRKRTVGEIRATLVRAGGSRSECGPGAGSRVGIAGLCGLWQFTHISRVDSPSCLFR